MPPVIINAIVLGIMFSIVGTNRIDPALFTIFILTVVLSLLFVIIGPSGMAENAKWLCSRKKDKD